MLFQPCGHGADVAVHRCKLPDKKCCLEGFRVGLADSGHQDFLMDVNAAANGAFDIPIRRADDPGAVLHCQGTQLLR